MSTDLFLAVDKNPQDVKAFETLVKAAVSADDRATLEQVYEAVPRWAPGNAQNHMVRVLSQHTRTAPAAELQAWMSYKNGLLFWKTYGDAQMAEMAFRKVEALPDEPGAAELLRGFYTDFYVAQGNWRRLEQVLTEPAKGGFDDPTMVRRMLAQLAEQKDQADKAIGFWGQVRGAEPTDLEAEEALRRLYTKVGKWNAMVDLLKEQLDRYNDDEVDEKTLVHLEMIDIYKNKLNAPAKVVASWVAILEISPSNVQALDALASEYTEMKRWPDLVKVLAQKVEHETDPKKLVALHKQIANIHQEKFNNANEAIKSWEAILELEPDNREALKTLKDIYEQRRDYDNLVAVSERELDLVTDEKKRFKQLVDLAKMASEKLRRPQTPIALWERVLGTDSTHKEALHELETWFEREKNWERLAEILERRVELETDVPTQVGLLDKLGNVVSSRLGDAERAADVWRQILARDREHRKAQAELRKKYVAERDWDGLEWFFRNYGDVGEWVRTLEQQVKAIDEPEEKTTLLFKAAAIWREELKDTRRAVKNLEAVLEIEPRHAEAARMLIPIYQELGSWRELPNVYEIVLEATEDPYERKGLLLALAAVHEDKLDDVEASFFNFVQAVSENPGEVELHPKLRQLAERSGNWESYVHVLQDAVDHIESDQHRVEVLLEIGHTYRDRLDADETSLTFFYRVLSLDPYNGQALDAAERAWEATGQYDQLVLTYQKRLTTLTDPAERLVILFKLANVWRNFAKANDEAEAVLSEMLEDYPNELRVHDQLIEIRLEEKRFADLRDVLEKKRDVLSSAQAKSHVLADLEYELGLLAYATAESGDEAGLASAIDRFEAALGHDPLHADTVSRLEELLSDDNERLRITKLLAPVYELVEDRARLSQMFELQWVAARNDDDTVTQVELLTKLGAIYRGPALGLAESALSNEELAWRTQARLFLLKPEAGEVRGELEALTATLSESSSRWHDLVVLYSQEADTPLDKESRVAIKLEVARTWHRRLGERDNHLEEAKTFYQKVREEEPEHKESIDALEEIYVALDRAEDLLEIYRGQIDLSPDTDKKIDYLFRTVDLMRDRLEDPEGAIAPAQEALALSPGHLGAIARLDELFTKTERWEDLAQTLEDTIRIVAHDQKRVVELKNRLALVYEKHLERPETAIEIHASVLAVEPENDNAIESLERLFEREELAPTVAPILQPVYQAAGDWQRLIDVYTVREQASGDFNEKVDWHYKIAALYEGPGQQPEAAFTHYEEAANLDPNSELTLSELLRLADLLDNHGELILFLQSIVEDIPSIERRIETHRTIAVLARDKSNDLPGADKQFRAILDIDPTDMAATDALIALYRDSSDTKNLVEMLLKKAPMAAVSTEQRNGLYAEAGNLASDVLRDHAQAIEIFETLHGLDPNGDVALDALEKLYEKTEDWDNLVRIYREKIDRAGDLDKKKHYAALTGMVQADQLESKDDAVATWLQILAWDSRDRDAMAQLDVLYTQQGDWFNLKETLRKIQADEELSHGAVSTPSWDEAQFRIAKLHEDPDKLGDLDTAIDCYGALLSRNVGHAQSVLALEELIAKPDGYAKAFATLKPFLESRSAFEELWQQYEVLVSHDDLDPERRVAMLHEMADLAEIRLSDSRRGLNAQARAFTVSPRDAHTLAELERLAEQYGFWEELVGIYTTEANATDDEMLQLDLRLKAGRILMDRIDDDVRATSAYELIAKDNPDHAEVQDRLHRLYERRGMWKELAGVLRSQADAETAPAGRIAFLEKLAMISEKKLEDRQKAYEALVEILDVDRGSEHAIGELRRLFELGVNPLDIAERLEPIYRDGQRWEELDSLYQLKLSVIEDPVDQLQLMRDLALLAIEKRGNERDALEWYGQALMLDPEDEGLYVEMERLAGLTGAWDRLNFYTLESADVVSDKERKIELWLKAGPVARDRLGDLAGAEATFRKVVALDGKHMSALRAIDQLVTSAGRWEDLEPVLLAETQADDLFDDERIQVWTRLAELYRDRLGQSDAAIGAYKEVLELQDMNEGALTSLRDIYGQRKMWPELFEILQRLSDLSRDVDERVDYLSTMAEIAEQSLGQPNRAIELYEDVLAARPDDVEAVRQLERLLLAQASKSQDPAEREKLYSALAESYERELRMETANLSNERKLEVFRLLGRLWQSELDDAFNAQNAWERARNVEPFDREALDALRGLHLASGNDQARGEIIEAQLVSERYDEAEQLELWRELAEIRTEVFGDQAGGIEAWQAVLVLSGPPEAGDDRYAKAIAELEVLYENTQRWQDLVGLYGKKLELIDGEDKRIETQLLIGTIQVDNLHDAAQAAETYRGILAGGDVASESDALRALRLEASRRLELIYEASEQWAPMAELLLTRNERLDAEDRVPNLQRLAQIHEQKLGEQVDAFVVLQSANELVPDDPMILSELERLAAATGLWSDLYGVYESTLVHLQGDEQLELMLKSAAVQRDKIGSPTEAIRLYERVLGVQDDNDTALRALIELDESEGRYGELVAVMRTLAELTPDYAEKKSLLQRVAVVEEQKLENLENAVKAYNEVLEMDERDKATLAELERLHIARRDWHALIDVYEKDAMADPANGNEVNRRLQIAGIYESYTRQLDEAIAAYEDVLGVDPANDTALDKLERIYGEREDYDALLDVYERAYNAARSDEDRLRMAKNAAILHDGYRQDMRSAADAWSRVLQLDPVDSEAFESLTRIYTAEKEWDDLIRLYEHRYEVADNSDGRADALLAMASVYRHQRDDIDNATAMYERVLLERRSDQTALDALDELLSAEGRWEQVIENIDKKLEVEVEPATRVELLCRQGLISRTELGDNYRSAASYSRVLQEAPGNETAVSELLDIYKEDERWDKVIEVLNHKLAHAKSRIDAAAIHVDLAEVLSDKLGQTDQALQHFEEAEQADPESRRALQVLADHYMRSGFNAKAMTRLEALIDKLDPHSDRELLGQTHKKIGLCAEALFLDDQAIDELTTASSILPLDLEGLRALGRLHFKRGNYREAERYLQEVIDKYKRDLSSDEQVAILVQLGESALKTKNIQKAQIYLRQVVDAQPNNPKALENIIEVLRAHGELEDALRYMERLLALKQDKVERYQIIMAIGDICHQELGDERRAVEAYRSALELDVLPKAPALRLFELYLRAEDYVNAMSNLNRLIKLEEDPKVKAKYANMAAVVYREKLRDPVEAVKYYNVSLDFDIERLTSFEAIVQILTQLKDNVALNKNYRRMIERVMKAGTALANSETLLFQLFMGLGEIYRSRLNDPENAVVTFQLARERRPDDPKVREILAELYERTDALDKAINEHRWIIAREPANYESYRSLMRLFKKAKWHDAAWCVAALLVALKRANAEEAAFYERYRSPSMAEPNRVVDQAIWSECIMSRQEDAELSRVIEIVYMALGKARVSKNPKDYQLKKKSRLELNEGLLVTNTIVKVLRMFGMAAPEMYKGELASGIEFLQTDPPMLRFGVDVLQGLGERELAFHIARRMAYFIPSHLVAILYPREALDGLYLGAAMVVDPNYQVATHEGVAEEDRMRLMQAAGEARQVLEKNLTPELRQQLTATMRSLWRRTPVPELGRWHRAVELTAIHAGVAASNDPALALSMLQAEPHGMSRLSKQDKLKDHVLYTLSDAYLVLRKQLGLQIDYSDLMG